MGLEDVVGATDRVTEGAACGVGSVGVAVAAPTAVSTSATPTAPAPAARLGSLAHRTRPRTRAMTATTNR